jgi:predicted membrane protein
MTKRSFVLFLLAIVLSVLFYFFFWSLCCLFFSTFSFGQMTKRKSRKEQTTQWPKEKVEKNRQHNDQKKK